MKLIKETHKKELEKTYELAKQFFSVHAEDCGFDELCSYCESFRGNEAQKVESKIDTIGYTGLYQYKVTHSFDDQRIVTGGSYRLLNGSPCLTITEQDLEMCNNEECDCCCHDNVQEEEDYDDESCNDVVDYVVFGQLLSEEMEHCVFSDKSYKLFLEKQAKEEQERKIKAIALERRIKELKIDKSRVDRAKDLSFNVTKQLEFSWINREINKLFSKKAEAKKYKKAVRETIETQIKDFLSSLKAKS